MSTRMQQRRGTAEQWTGANPVLAAGEMGWESDTNKFKIGDGVNSWSNLEYFQDGSTISGSLENYVELDSLGVADGVATLDATGNVPLNQLGNIIDGAPGVLDTLNELAAALNDDADFFTTITNSISSGDSATLASAESYADGLAVNYDPAGSADAAQAAAELYADGLAVNYDPAGSAAAAQSAAESYADGLVGDATVDGTTGNTVTDRIATAVADLVDSAPETLDTLNELAAALGDDANFATTVTNAIAAKADASHTHLIADLTDFSITTPENGSILMYNSTTSKWEDAIIINGGNA